MNSIEQPNEIEGSSGGSANNNLEEDLATKYDVMLLTSESPEWLIKNEAPPSEISPMDKSPNLRSPALESLLVQALL